MLCDVCKENNATVYLTQIINGQVQKVNLCQSCSEEKGVTDPTGFALADLLVGIGGKSKAPSAPATDESCSECGFTQADFKKTGRLGCSHCYQIFGEGLDNLLKAMHKGTRHVGKVPVVAHAAKEAADKLGELQESLEDAIAEERYEEAAALRDKIQKMKG